jgi:FtsP/CotA-like multicopper oxidase with cupredoxin domain
VATISQCPIVPGGNLTYRFRADEYGTSWYHAHHSAQYSAGVLGPIVVHGPNEAEYDLDLGPILITDWFHDMYDHLVDLVMQPSFGPPFRPISDSNLVAGKGAYACVNSTQPNSSTCAPPSSFAAWEFEAGKTYRMRFVNTGSSAFEQISLDGHTFTVIANDFVPVQPYETDFVTIGVGQRTDVLVTANATPGQSYWLRAFNNPCGDTDGPYGYGIINYSGANCSIAPTSQGKPPPPNSRCQNDPLSKTVPQYAIPAKEPDTTITLFMDGKSDDQGYFHWTFNGNSYTGDLSQPDLFSAVQGQSLPPERNVYVPQGKTVRLIVYSNLPAPHPMHIHGHDFQVLAEGLGTWDGQIVNPSNPQRRDVHMAWFGVNTNTNTTAGGGDGTAAAGAYYMVLQYEQDNPGIWPFHCHIAWHLSKGMTIMLLELPEELAKIEIPEVVTATCERYKVWQAAANPRVGEGDAGS